MDYLIPIGILLAAGLIWPTAALIVKYEPKPATWNWRRIFWIVMPICLAWTFIVPALNWPQPCIYPAIAVVWYIIGRREQQDSHREYRLKHRMEKAR